MYSDKDALVWQRNLSNWADSIHRKRLERAFLEAILLLNEDPERLLHAFSRLGIWTAELAKANARGEVDEGEMRGQLSKVSEFGGFAFERWSRRAEEALKPQRRASVRSARKELLIVNRSQGAWKFAEHSTARPALFMCRQMVLALRS